MTDLSDSMRARLEAELRAEGGQNEPTAAAGGLFSLGHIALASLLGAGFGGVVLVVRNDKRLDARHSWRGPAWYLGILVVGGFVGMLALPHDLRGTLGPWLLPLLLVLGPVAIAWNLQMDAILDRPREARLHEPLLLAIGLGWVLAATFWIPVSMLLLRA